MTISSGAWTPSQAGEARFRTIFEQSPVSTQVFSPDGTTLAVNRAWEELWGTTLDRIPGYNVLKDQQLVARGVMPFILRGFAGEATAIPAVKYEPDRTIPNTGAVPYRWVKAWIYPVKNPDGSVREVVLMHEDITEQVSAEESLRVSEERFRAIFDGAPVGISLIDAHGRYVSVNRVRQEMLGFTERELIGKHYLEITHPDDVEYDEQVNAEAQERGENHYQLEKRFVRKDGTVHWTRVTVSMVRDEDGNPSYSVAITEDITGQKQIEEERRRLLDLERLAHARADRLVAEREAILGQIAEGIIIVNPDGQIAFANNAARAIHGVEEFGPPGDPGSGSYQLLTLDGCPHPREDLPLVRALSHGETVVDATWRVRHPNGQEVVVQGSAVPVVAPDGGRLGVVLTVRDVTAQHDLARQKDEFLSAAAHDLRTPLTTIKGRLQLLRHRAQRGVLESARLIEDLGRIEVSATRMIALINELLDVANIQIGRPLTLDRRPVDLISLAREAVAEYRHSTVRHRFVVQTDVPELVGSWDPVRLERVLANLLSNAIKYSPQGGDITVAVAREDGEAVLTVRDQGIGIPAEDLPHIFDRFHRAGNSAGKIPGTGIGLSAVRTIVEQHDGTIAASSEPGAGATFIVRLPITPEGNAF